MTRRSSPDQPARPSEVTASRQIAVLIVAILVYVLLFFLGYISENPYSPHDFILYATGISAPIIILLLVLLRFLCHERPSDLNRQPGRFSTDLIAAVLLSFATLTANIVCTGAVSQLLPAPPNIAVINLFTWLHQNPVMLGTFLGCFLWIGVAQEELTRVVLLSRLWRLSPSRTIDFATIVFAGILFGLSHGWQGPTRVVCAGIYGFIMGLFYYRYGRVAPMIISHYMTNGLQIVVFAFRMPQ